MWRRYAQASLQRIGIHYEILLCTGHSWCRLRSTKTAAFSVHCVPACSLGYFMLDDSVMAVRRANLFARMSLRLYRDTCA